VSITRVKASDLSIGMCLMDGREIEDIMEGGLPGVWVYTSNLCDSRFYYEDELVAIVTKEWTSEPRV